VSDASGTNLGIYATVPELPPFGIINALMGIRHRFLLAASLFYLTAANLIWIARDTRPPYWDMADKQIGALKIYDAIATSGIRSVTTIPFLTGAYPPLYHSIIAASYSIFGKTIDAAQWANIPAIALLLIATYGIGRTLLKPFAAATGAVIVTFYPLLVWLSRETLIDYWLTSLVALAIWMLMQTNEFSSRKHSIIFGIVCGFGMLTKWTFGLFVIFPALWFARKNMKNAAIAASIAVVISAYWYAFAEPALLSLLSINSTQSFNEGDPGRFSMDAVTFYIRTLEGSQLFLPLFVLLIAGFVLLFFNFSRSWIPIVLWIAGGWLGLLFFQNKDPRYTAPLLPAIALITALVFQKRESLLALLIPLLLGQHYLVSFGIPQLPPAVVLAKGGDGPVAYHWNLYTQSYFGWGPPAREDWKIEHVLQRVTSREGPVRLGMVPDIPRFDTLAFQFYITLQKLPVSVIRLAVFDEQAIGNNDYVLISEKDDGFEPGSYFTSDLKRIHEYVNARTDTFHLIESFALPNGDAIHLYKVGGL
jgi:Dolichyl-phosphate-mannose-protein mannosyltransferase